MDIKLTKITVGQLAEGYEDNDENGVVGFGGKLNIRPKYQREFVYKDSQRNAVIDTVTKNFPLNVMYWAACDDGTFEIIDGQQRTISLCQYVTGVFSFNMRYFHNLQSDEQRKILDYPLDIYICSGTDSEKLEWFRTINIAGEKLTEQELRNAVYAGSWVSDAKRYFSKSKCAAQGIGGDYMSGAPIRQEYLETAIDWISDGHIEEYMAGHQHDPVASELWRYFQSVIAWVETTFTVKRPKIMRSVAWGTLYNRYKDELYDPRVLERRIYELLSDDDVQRQSGIYPYLLTGDEKHLSIRAFSDKMKQTAYEKQKGICAICGEHFEISEMEGDHITPWSEGGKTVAENCQMLCRQCNRRKSNK